MEEYFQLQVLSELSHNIFILEENQSKNYVMVNELVILRLSSGGNYFDDSIHRGNFLVEPEKLCPIVFRVNRSALFLMSSSSRETFNTLNEFCKNSILNP